MVLILDKENRQFTKINNNVVRVTWGEYQGDLVYSDIQLDILNSELSKPSGKDLCDCMNNFPSKRTVLKDNPNSLLLTFVVSNYNIGYTDYFYFEMDYHIWVKEVDNIFLNIYKPIPKIKKCTCGAAQTSNPNFHSSWCDIN